MIEKELSAEAQIKKFSEHMSDFVRLQKLEEEVKNLVHAYHTEGVKSEMFLSSLERLELFVV